MNTSKQRSYIESLVSESLERKKKTDIIQELYIRCIECFSDEDFTELIHLLEDFTRPWIRKQLWKFGCYTEEDEKDIMQDSAFSVWGAVQNIEKEGIIIENFAFYAYGIYKNKTRDYIRKTSKNRKEVIVISKEQYDKENEAGKGGLPPYQKDPLDVETKKKVYRGLFRLYCSSLMNSKAFPPRCLALYYARILPHLLSEIPDTKAASAKWAFKRMDHFTVWELTKDSENTLKEDVDESLAWNENYMKQLDKELPNLDYCCKLRDVVYTTVYSKEKIEDWSEYMHKVTLKEASRRLPEDKKLAGLVKEYVPGDEILKKLVKW